MTVPQVDPGHYQDRSYDTRERFLSYWHQADEVRQRQPSNMLEVGIGNGFLHRYLRSRGIDVHTLDIDERLGPDTVGSVLDLPFEQGSFDLVCCFETLEHLPWESFEPALRELRRVGRRWVLLSLPDITPYMRIDVMYKTPLREKKVRRLMELRGSPPVHVPQRSRSPSAALSSRPSVRSSRCRSRRSMPSARSRDRDPPTCSTSSSSSPAPR